MLFAIEEHACVLPCMFPLAKVLRALSVAGTIGGEEKAL